MESVSQQFSQLVLTIENRGEKPAIGQFLRGSLPWLTNDKDTKREKMTSVCFGLPWQKNVNKIMPGFEQNEGTNLKVNCNVFTS